MNTRLSLFVLSFVSLGALTTPASAYKVKVPTGGDIVTVSVPVVNLSDDYIRGGSFGQASTGFLFTGYDGQFSTLNVAAPHTTGTVEFEFVASGTFTEEDNFQLPLFGFSNLSPGGGLDFGPNPDFTDNDPGLKIDLVSENAGPCGLDPNCVTFTLPNTITVPATSTSPATVPEPAPMAAFGLGAVGLIALMVKTSRRQKA